VLTFIIPGRAIPHLLIIKLKNAQRSGKLWSPEMRASYGTLYLRFRPDAWYFEFVIMLRKCLLAGTAAFLPDDPAEASALSAIILVASITLQRAVKPCHSGAHVVAERADGTWAHNVEGRKVDSPSDKLEVACLATLLATYALGFVSAELKPKDGSMIGLVISIAAIVIVLLPVFAARRFIQEQKNNALNESLIGPATSDSEAQEMDVMPAAASAGQPITALTV